MGFMKKKKSPEIVDAQTVSAGEVIKKIEVPVKESVEVKEPELSAEDTAWMNLLTEAFKKYELTYSPTAFVNTPGWAAERERANLYFAIFGELVRLNGKLDKLLELAK